ncbi:MAG: UDP-2,3-diacylglucosamine diphosphatase [Pseudomonadota bacterium]
MIPKSRSDTILLISDLHLQATRPDLTQAFFAFLITRACHASALFILGDFFNVWIGDDDDDALCGEVSNALRQLADTGTAIYLLHGNRDFLLGHEYAAACGATLLQEPFLLEHMDRSYVLLHGDILCTQDTDYQKFRAIVRDPEWQQQFLARPLLDRRAFAEQARKQSVGMSGNKPADIMDVTQSAVEQLLREQQVPTMIHGHTHRPAIHKFTSDDKMLERVVIGDWDKYGWYVELDAAGAHQFRFSLQTGEILT